MEGAQLDQSVQSFDRDLLGDMLCYVSGNLLKLADRQSAAKFSLAGRRSGVFLGQVGREKMCEIGNDFRASANACVEQFGTSCTHVIKGRVAAEKINHFRLVSLSWINRFQRGPERLNRYVHGNAFELFAGRRTEADLVGRPRAGDEAIAAPDLMRDPIPAGIALEKFRRTCDVAANVWLRGRGHQKTINDARKAPTPHVKSGPSECLAVRQNLAIEIVGKCRRSSFGRFHETD